MVVAMNYAQFSGEFAAEYASLLTRWALRDPKRLRFGARHHNYAMAPPETAAVPVALPLAYEMFIRNVSAGGAGPYYGLLVASALPAAVWQVALQPSHLPDGNDEAAVNAAAAKGPDPWRGALPVAELGCGYTALLVLNGPATGQIWVDARAVGLLAPIAKDFTAFLLDWLDRESRATLLLGYVPADVCALPNALAGYLAMWEQQHGVSAGDMTTGQVREAFAALGAGAIALAAQHKTPLHDENAPVNPCLVCAQLVERLGDSGLSSTVVAWAT